MLPSALLIAALAASPVELSDSQLLEAGNRFARCAGVWRVLADQESEQGKPASSEQMRGFERGALLSAQWAFAHRWTRRNPGEPPRAYGDFDGPANELAERGASHVLALAEQ